MISHVLLTLGSEQPGISYRSTPKANDLIIVITEQARHLWRIKIFILSSLPSKLHKSSYKVLRSNVVLLVLDGLINRLVDERFDIRTTPVLALIYDLLDHLIIDEMQLSHFLLQNRIEDPPSLLLARKRDIDLYVESTWTKHCTVHEVDSVCCPHYDHLLVWIKTIHLTEKLVDCWGGLVRVSEVVESASEGIDFIDEDDASVWWFSRILEELSDSFGANPNKHLLELRSNHFYEAAPCLVGQGSSKQGLPSPRRPVEHDPPPNPGPHRLVFLRIMQKVYNLLKLLLDLLPSIKIIKRRPSRIPLRLKLRIGQCGFIDLTDHILEG